MKYIIDPDENFFLFAPDNFYERFWLDDNHGPCIISWEIAQQIIKETDATCYNNYPIPECEYCGKDSWRQYFETHQAFPIALCKGNCETEYLKKKWKIINYE